MPRQLNPHSWYGCLKEALNHSSLPAKLTGRYAVEVPFWTAQLLLVALAPNVTTDAVGCVVYQATRIPVVAYALSTSHVRFWLCLRHRPAIMLTGSSHTSLPLSFTIRYLPFHCFHESMIYILLFANPLDPAFSRAAIFAASSASLYMML